MDLAPRALKLDIHELEQLHTPCILHWDMKHFVVLIKVRHRKFIINDPAVGERALSYQEVDKLFTGIALELTPTKEFKQGNEKSHLTFSNFWTSIFGIKRSLATILCLSLILQLFTIAAPYYMQTVVDNVILRNNEHFLFVLAIGFSLLLVIQTSTSLLREFVSLNLSNRLSIQMSANVFHHLIRLPLDYFSKRHIGDVISRFGSLNSIRDLITDGIIAVVLDGLMALVTLIVMFIYDPKLSLIVITVVMLNGLIRWGLYRPIRLLNEESIVVSAKESSHFIESIRAIQTIKLFNRETDRQGQWQNKLADTMNKDIQLSKWDIGFSTANSILFGFENIIIIYFGAMAVIENTFSVGMLYAFIAYKGKFIGSINNLIEKYIEWRMLELHFDRLSDIVFTEKDKYLPRDQYTYSHQYTEQSCMKAIRGKIELKNISFRYSTSDPTIFENINLIIKPGETIAIVGASGSGKSTLMKCMMGFFSLTQGEIFIDNKRLSDITDFRMQIAGILQDDQLLSGTIAENIACFDTHFNMENVINSAIQASIHDDIMQFPMQYNTFVGDMGSSLSGGQKQRLIIARALYRKPKIIYMDEATSHLDLCNENNVSECIKEMNITRVIIAHRLETILSAETILELKDGKLQDVTHTFTEAALAYN